MIIWKDAEKYYINTIIGKKAFYKYDLTNKNFWIIS